MVYRSDFRYLSYSIHSSEFMPVFFFHEKTDKTREYSKSAIFVSYDNVRRRLLVAQSISSDKASLNVVSFCLFQSGKSSMTVSDVQELQIEKEKVK